MNMAGNNRVPEGQYTATVYTAIKETRYAEAVQLLTSELGVSCSWTMYVRHHKRSDTENSGRWYITLYIRNARETVALLPFAPGV